MIEPLSGSRLDALICPFRYYLSYERNLELIEDEPRMLAGSAIHAALDYWYGWPGSNLDCGDQECRDTESVVQAATVWGSYQPPFGSELSYLTWGHVENVLRRYFDHWRDRETLRPLNLEVASVIVGGEELITAEFDGQPYCGRLDLPVEDQGGNIYVLDHKCTTGNMGKHFFNSFAVSNQLRGYAAILQELLGKRVAGVIGNGIYMGKSSRKPESAFQRKSFEFQPWSLNEFVDNVKAAQAEIQWRREHDCWPQRTGARICGNCHFWRVCKASPAVRPRLIERDYRQGRKR